MEFRYQDGCADPVAQPKSELTALWRATNAAWMLLLPSLAFLAIRQETLEPMHKEYVSYWLLVLDLKTAGWFALPIVAAIVLTITALLQPEIAETPLGRLGLHVARAFALSYCVGIALGSVLIGLIPVVAVLATIVLFRAAVKNPEARQVSALIVLAAITLVYLADAPTEQVRSSNGYLVVPLLTLLASPFICDWIIRGLLNQTTAPLAPMWAYWATGPVLASTWFFTLSRALERYNELPPPPDCYVATAAASGHPRFVGSTPGPGGVSVNNQLQVLKAGELILASLAPRTHRRIRRVYDRFGPRAAGVLRRHQLAADVAFLMLLPIHLMVRLLLTMGLPHTHRRLVKGIYR